LALELDSPTQFVFFFFLFLSDFLMVGTLQTVLNATVAHQVEPFSRHSAFL